MPASLCNLNRRLTGVAASADSWTNRKPKGCGACSVKFRSVVSMPDVVAKKSRRPPSTLGCFCLISSRSEAPPLCWLMYPSASKKPAKYSQLHGPATAESYFFSSRSSALRSSLRDFVLGHRAAIKSCFRFVMLCGAKSRAARRAESP